MYVYKQIYTHTLLHTCFAHLLHLFFWIKHINDDKCTFFNGIFHIFEKPKSSSTSFKIQRSSEVRASARGVRTSPCPWPSAGPESPNWLRTRWVFLSRAGHVAMVTGLAHTWGSFFLGQKRTWIKTWLWYGSLLLFKRQFWKSDFSHSTEPCNINQ